MLLEKAAVEEFIELYSLEYGIKLTYKEALEYGTRLVGLVKAVYGRDLLKIDLDNEKNKKEN